MKILHTADWHAGRTLHGMDRTPEVREVLQEIAEIARDRAVDLVLVAGDLFDSRSPSAAAEAAVYEFFTTLGSAGIPSVTIAGNHDAPARLDAVEGILRLARVRAVGSPRVAGAGGTFEVETHSGTAVVAALPFLSERRIVKVTELLEGDAGTQRESYRQSMRRLVNNLAGGFRGDAVNLLVMHTTMEGATLANSEYQFHATETYTLPADILPDAANYVALGHIHKPQPVVGAQANWARYSGSILQLDFGEQEDRKGVLILEARPGRPTELLEEVHLRAGRRLKRVRVGESELERRVLDLGELDAWLKLVVSLEEPRPGLKDRLMRELPNLLAVEVELAHDEIEEVRGVDVERVGLREAYGSYYREARGQELPEALGEAFEELLELAAGEPEAVR